MVELTNLVLIGAVTVSLMTITWNGFALRFPIILTAVFGHAFFLYQWSGESGMTPENWFALHFVTIIPLIIGLVLCLSRGSRSRAVFLALAYCAYLASFMAICSMLLCRKNLALSANGRFFAIWFVVAAFNFAFVFLVSRRVALCHRQSSWGLPSLAVGSLFVLLVASGQWPVSLIAASRVEMVIFALVVLVTGVTIPALCHPSRDHVRSVDDKKEAVSPVVEEKAKADAQDEQENKGEGEQRNQVIDAQHRVHDEPAPLPIASPSPSSLASPSSNLSASPSPSPSSSDGKALFEQARAMVHQMIPDFDHDREYLDLLCKSAAAGYAPAMAKLGEYAWRRDAWVEAYYWMKLAKLKGLGNLDTTLREIRRVWAMEGFPNQSGNFNELFTPEAGSLGRALLHLDSGHEASAAREFLKAHYPEFLSERTNLAKG